MTAKERAEVEQLKARIVMLETYGAQWASHAGAAIGLLRVARRLLSIHCWSGACCAMRREIDDLVNKVFPGGLSDGGTERNS